MCMYIYEGREKFDSGIYDANNIKVNLKNEENNSGQKLVEFDEGYSNNIDKVELSPEAKENIKNNSEQKLVEFDEGYTNNVELSSEAEYYWGHGGGGRGTRRGGNA
jgi:hypothetical protein